MQNMQCIHETIIRDIVDVAQGLKDSDEIQRISNYNNNMSWKSIANKSDALTLVFPVLASRNISYEAAAMVSKAIERKAVTMLQMLFSAINITDAKDGIDYLTRFHRNLDTGRLSVDEFIGAMDTFVDENGLIKESSQFEEYEKVKKDLKNLDFYFENNINDDSISDYKIITIEGTQILVHEAPYSKLSNNSISSMDDSLERIRRRIIGARDTGDNTEVKRLEDEYNKVLGIRDKANQDLSFINNVQPEEERLIDIQSRTQIGRNRAELDRISLEINTKRLVDGDVKKANELVPSLMYVNFVTATQDSNYPITTSMVIGIKAKLYAIDSQDIMNRLKIKHNDKNTLLNLIKAGTREISFFKDFIFAIDKAKIDALSQSRRGSSNKIWKVLERRAIKSKLKRSMFMNNDASAISTLVISQEEVEYLKKTEYIDVENVRVINPILDAYNLMSFVIIDESLEVAKFIFDTGEDMYEVLTFNNLEREVKDNTKKIINLMSKMSR